MKPIELSKINNSTIDLYIEDNLNWHFENKKYTEGCLNFTYEVVDFEVDFLMLKLKWLDHTMVST